MKSLIIGIEKSSSVFVNFKVLHQTHRCIYFIDQTLTSDRINHKLSRLFKNVLVDTSIHFAEGTSFSVVADQTITLSLTSCFEPDLVITEHPDHYISMYVRGIGEGHRDTRLINIPDAESLRGVLILVLAYNVLHTRNRLFQDGLSDLDNFIKCATPDIRTKVIDLLRPIIR